MIKLNNQKMKMNTKQQEIYDEIISHKLKYVFISGTAGTGKSRLLMELKDHFGYNCIVVALSAIAARNVQGQTIHSVFRLNFDGHCTLNSKKYSYLDFDELFNFDILIIDEISMVSNIILDNIDKCLREFCYSDLPFAGKTVICFGDLYQLEPIRNDYTEQNILPVFYSKVWEIFVYRELTENMRQSEDIFIDNLNLLRQGKLETLRYFNQFVKRIPDQVRFNSLALFAQNNQARAYNLKLFSMVSQGQNVRKITIKIKNIEVDSEELGFAYPDKAIDVIFYDNMKICKNTRIIFTVNDKKNNRFLNGEMGKIIDFNPRELIIEKDDNNVITVEKVDVLIRQQGHLYQKSDEIFPVKKVSGYPIIYGWACTVHKVQGITTDKLILEQINMFANGQLYVALSRLRHSDGLFLRNKIPLSSIKCNHNVTSEYERLNKKS